MTTGTPVVVSRIQNRRGTQAQFDALYPSGQPGTGANILQPGEIALITDPPGKVYIGSLNGTYFEIGSGGSAPTSSNLTMSPLVVSLAPASVWTEMLTPITATPFFSLFYSIVDTVTSNPNNVGTNFSKNGELQITSTSTAATLLDTGTEINTTTYDINFKVEYFSGSIKFYYMHNFPSALTFSTSSIIWRSI